MPSHRARRLFAADVKIGPKQPRAAADECFSAVPRLANNTEKLLYALILSVPGNNIDDLHAWAGEVRLEASRLKEQGDAWAPSSPADWSTSGGQYGRLVLPMACAIGSVGSAEHAQAATALQVLRLPGHRDGCTAKQIENYMYKRPREPGSKKKGRAGGTVRWCGRALVDVAELVWIHGKQLRSAMRGEMDKLPSVAEELKETRAALAEEKRSKEEERQKAEQAAIEARRAKDAHRKLKDKKKLQRTKARAKAKQEKKTALEKARADFKKRLKEAKARQTAEARRKATEDAAAEQDKLKKRLAAAKKRARKKESAAKQSDKYLKRAKKAEKALKSLQATLEEEPEEEDTDDCSDAEGSDGEDSHTPAIKGKGRRDARGRFESMPQHVRVLVWAQLARRVPPSAIAGNISDAIGALAPEDEAGNALPCERTILKMRGELTVASEAIAAFRVALAKRVISFGWDESTKFGLGLLSSNTQVGPAITSI